MTNTGMFFRMLFSAVFRRRSRAVMAVVASLVGAATLFCLAMICLAVPQQMNEEMRAYGANLIVTPTESTNADGKAGIDKAMVQHTTEMVKAKGSAKYATYRYENVRVNASPYVMAGVNAAQVKNLNHHWVVDGSWPTDGKVLVGRDIADAIGLRIGSAIMAAASLSFLGFGANVSEPEWGAMLSQGRNYIGIASHMVYFPGLIIFITVLAFNLFGDGLRDTLDPKIK